MRSGSRPPVPCPYPPPRFRGPWFGGHNRKKLIVQLSTSTKAFGEPLPYGASGVAYDVACLAYCTAHRSNDTSKWRGNGMPNGFPMAGRWRSPPLSVYAFAGGAQVVSMPLVPAERAKCTATGDAHVFGLRGLGVHSDELQLLRLIDQRGRLVEIAARLDGGSHGIDSFLPRAVERL